MRHTYFIDIDGTIIRHLGTLQEMELAGINVEKTPGSVEKINEMKHKDHKVILTTARPESMRKTTEKMLENIGVVYDVLLMGLPCGPRHVINDMKPPGKNKKRNTKTAFAHNLIRDQGFGFLSIE